MGVSVESIRNFFWLMNAPGKLYALIHISEQISNAINLGLEPSLNHKVSIFHDWLKILDYIVTHKEDVLSHIEYAEEGLGKPIVRNPLMGKGISRNAMYMGLWNRHEDSDRQDPYHRLQWHMILAHTHLMASTVTRGIYESYDAKNSIFDEVRKKGHSGFGSSVSSGCRSLRRLSVQGNESYDIDEYLETYDPKSLKPSNTPSSKALLSFSHHDFCRIIIEKHTAESTSSQTNSLKDLGVFFQRAQESSQASNLEAIRQAHKRGRSTYKRYDGYVRLSESLISSEKANISINETETQCRVIKQVPEDSSTVSILDLMAGETESDEDLMIFTNTPKVKTYKTYLSNILAAQGLARSVMLQNQMLPNQWGTLTIYEVSQLIKFCETKFRNIIDNKKDNQLTDGAYAELATVTLILVMLWTGSTLKRAKALVIKQDSRTHTSELSYYIGSSEWRIRSNLLKYRTDPISKQKNISRPQKAWLFLPDIYGLGLFLKTLEKEKVAKGYEENPFKKINSRVVKFCLNSLPNGHRITEDKISKYLFNTVAALGDITDAIHMTATNAYLGSTTIHYSTPSANDIRALYANTVATLMSKVYAEVYPEKNTPSLGTYPSYDEQYVGSRLCPKRTEIQSLVHFLTQLIKDPPTDRTVTSYVDYHNKFTIFTCLYLGYATGFRAVVDPYVFEEQIDKKTGFAVISDKDNADCYKSRISWIPDCVQEQLSNYIEHRQYVLSTISTRNETSREGNSKFMFFLEESLDEHEIRPKFIEQQLSDIFPMPTNVNRRYLRTTLKEMNCPVEIINCFMGHWSKGEEPWGKFSSLSYSQYKHEISQYIPEILTDLGFKPRKSRASI